jgi:hypothetical protein
MHVHHFLLSAALFSCGRCVMLEAPSSRRGVNPFLIRAFICRARASRASMPKRIQGRVIHMTRHDERDGKDATRHAMPIVQAKIR